MSDTPSGKIRTILIGTDLDRDSDALLSTGVQVARAAGAKIHVAYAFPPPMGYMNELGAGVNEAVLAQEMEQIRGAMSAQVRQAGISADELPIGASFVRRCDVGAQHAAPWVPLSPGEGVRAQRDALCEIPS